MLRNSIDWLEGEQNHAGDPFLSAAVRSALDQSMLGGPGGTDPGGIAASSGPTGSGSAGDHQVAGFVRGVFRVWSIV